MVNDRRAMYDKFNDKCAHFAEWFQIIKDFLKLDFVGFCREVKCPCNRCLVTFLRNDLCRTILGVALA
jgi:hypothetical protein